MRKITRKPATNTQFCKSGGVGSQKVTNKFVTFSPVRTAVSRHLRKAANRCAP